MISYLWYIADPKNVVVRREKVNLMHCGKEIE